MSTEDVPLYTGRMGSYCCVCSDAATSPSSLALSTAATTTVAADPATNRIHLVHSSHDFDESLPTSFEFTSVLPSGFHPKDVFEQVSAPIEDIVCDGFNASMVCYGSSTLKRATTVGLSSSSLLAASPHAALSTTCLADVLAAFGQIGGILWRLFQHNHGLEIGLSCWVVHHNTVRDMLHPSPPPPSDQPLQFKTIRVTSLRQALALLQRPLHHLEAAAHLFVRIAVYAHEADQQLSLLHFVELGVGTSEEDAEFVGLFDALGGCDEASTPSTDPASCAPLTQFLAPLVAGNSHTFLLGFVDARVPAAMLDVLWIMSGVRLASCACVKLTGIDRTLLDFEPFPDTIDQPIGGLQSPSSLTTVTQKLFGASKDVAMRRRSSAPSNESMSVPLPAAIATTSTPKEAHHPIVPLLRLPGVVEDAQQQQHSPSHPVTISPSTCISTSPKWNHMVPPAPSADLSASSWIELLQEAHVPAMAPPAPIVSGLDAESAAVVTATEAQLLRTHYDRLLTVLKDQHAHTTSLQHQLDEFHVAQEEAEAIHHVQLQDLKLVNVDLRSKLRVLETQSGMQAVLEKYDVEIHTVTSELEKLRAVNLGLELKLAANASVDLRNRYRDIVKENVRLHEQVLALRKKERHFLSSKKMVDESAKKIDALSKLVTTKDDMLMEARLGEARLSAQVDHQQQKSVALQQQQSVLAAEHDKAAEELIAVKMYLASIQTEQRKAEMLDRFVKKHGTSLLSTDKQKSNNPNLQDHGTKVLGAIKRTVPALVPSVHKLLQRLHVRNLKMLVLFLIYSKT
ncbi:hypothetical protein, variant 2 [Aphanomyces astaci]|uniref:Uncharacterized protein n=1 Tax=Aphanomyces astaci TaxID=112090 RepID=W4FC19_APHAT|nr:hypothetical protein, variant 2 [Aphanomyces astaci]ETV65015.1 hypothetical protein, variant 2 [Aphanomyces astaci]|eukprot:XP_009845505.1 hypothetical protein, variant 2 [Aphanomyces astaci]